MRVITGTARGRKLKALQGNETRPTADRVKEAVFSVIQFDVEGRRVLDLFAGSGQMGIEALSRGASSAVFVDMSPQAAAVIRENLSAAGFTRNSRLVTADGIGFLSSAKEQFDLIFLDPPYATKLINQALKLIEGFDILAKDGIIICESDVKSPEPEAPSPLRLHREYRYGRTKIRFYTKG
ncbi:16S rRNA (guanine(966)-N(2))-methyltransferase RsmD [Papillibacter cinnamivorans]|uniref:16S rRNA (Guanine(966)-N(2))-methyltransferase RsmD n=1 Tax=Papillibacter cinnamivorans DSM 12816 TaxID=1122930 RepID=A0A1W1Z0K8_9FIRM|nr:16S rRNA (guanine(966)-N(2))-methyltransferase RsmD [Papillibacter cinnamivorans]SMC41621.1 16S rRNA (guanine(966)-N(2))-methyltransferase RsmD [Papillibacter cinnamivorans DSM 12816]